MEGTAVPSPAREVRPETPTCGHSAEGDAKQASLLPSPQPIVGGRAEADAEVEPEKVVREPPRERDEPARLCRTFYIVPHGNRVEVVDDEIAVREYQSLMADLEAAQRCALVS